MNILNKEKMEKQEQLVGNPRRSILKVAVATILTEKGFAKADKECVESLTEVNIDKTFLPSCFY